MLAEHGVRRQQQSDHCRWQNTESAPNSRKWTEISLPTPPGRRRPRPSCATSPAPSSSLAGVRMMDIAVAPPDEDGIVLVTLGGDDDQPWGTPQEECAAPPPPAELCGGPLLSLRRLRALVHNRHRLTPDACQRLNVSPQPAPLSPCHYATPSSPRLPPQKGRFSVRKAAARTARRTSWTRSRATPPPRPSSSPAKASSSATG